MVAEMKMKCSTPHFTFNIAWGVPSPLAKLGVAIRSGMSHLNSFHRKVMSRVESNLTSTPFIGFALDNDAKVGDQISSTPFIGFDLDRCEPLDPKNQFQPLICEAIYAFERERRESHL
ncbi:Uncharacterized protein Fot_15326 [Forsythia ovata]|uniref:Uncharacterized protein n=1 Tax=Forsythia ovata TaxID=205694 RepID=A0ABD1WBF7_9LAMI